MLCDFCVQTPEITAFYHMVGNFNVLLCFAVPDVKTLDALVSRVRTFGDSRTSIELQTVFEKVDPTKVPSRFMRKIVCRLRLNEVSRQ